MNRSRRASDQRDHPVLVIVPEETAIEHLKNAAQILRGYAFLSDEQRVGPDGLEIIDTALRRLTQALTQIEQETR